MSKKRRLQPPSEAKAVIEVDYVPTYLTAWRFWKIDRDDTGLCLRSLIVAQNWPKGELLVGSCRAAEVKNVMGCKHDPDQFLTFKGECGIYGYQAVEQAYATTLSEDYMRGRVIGEVALAGAIVVHKLGYRAEYAYPLSLVAAGCAQGGHLVSLPEAKLAERTEPANFNSGVDSSLTIYCREHAPATAGDLNWVGFLAAQYNLRVGGVREFLTG